MGWACQSAADYYQPQALSPEDARRASEIRSAKARVDWRVSRALLQHLRAASPAPTPHALSLSHSGGHALCAQAPVDWAIGADLERMRPRDLDALAAWVCSGAEQAWLRQADAPLRQVRFYLLWTLKEAFIKAAGLDFPADMASVGLTPQPSGALALRPPPGRWQAACWQLGDEWVAAAAWRAAAGEQARITWRAAVGCDLPTRQFLGQWEGSAG
ncbi:4'-phosphopantetheinyl transferase superfamily protein [Achromobacter sp. UMC71]|uniref:4'-phosphopantetheinyl transferase family protein n=1 Tax=Achromobacter sp. UMC71 TaxID=1862320 RepID=UPI0015FFD3D3|nr:4'-phosphopantetheinyl transferase superfamily protein [Achromobacter sp. UMC71]